MGYVLRMAVYITGACNNKYGSVDITAPVGVTVELCISRGRDGGQANFVFIR